MQVLQTATKYKMLDSIKTTDMLQQLSQEKMITNHKEMKYYLQNRVIITQTSIHNINKELTYNKIIYQEITTMAMGEISRVKS